MAKANITALFHKKKVATSQHIQRDLVDMLYGNAIAGIMVTILVFTGLTFGFETPMVQDLKHTFWVIVIIVAVGRLADTGYWYLRLKGTDYPPPSAKLRFSIGVILTAIMWCVYAIGLYENMALHELAGTMIVLAAMASGSATILAPSRVLVTIYCTLLLIPLSIVILFDNQHQFSVLGILGIVFWAALISSAFRYNAFFENTVVLKQSNTELVDQMTKERAEIAEVNAKLLDSNNRLDHANSTLEAEVEKRTSDILRLSNKDPLTNLLNRSGFLKHLNSLVETSSSLEKNFAVLFIDLDGFKQVNDSLGHEIGDIVLANIAQRLSRYCEDGHLGRWGGDEFVAVVPYATEDTAMAVAHAMRNGVTVPISANDNQVNLDATIGIALFPTHGKDALTLIQHADLTMYDKKREGSGTIGVFNEILHAQIRLEQSRRDKLRCAIENNELTVYYQPIIHTDTLKVASVEALLRWECDGEFVSPAEFIPLAERMGLINDIGRWVLHRACIDASQWPFEEQIGLSVNVSVIQLMDESFIRTLDNVLKTTPISPEKLYLEITESVFTTNDKDAVKRVNDIKARGVQVSIDDFGTGYSSLSRLQSMDCDFIKIDRSFVKNSDEGNDTILRATVLIANEFDCKTVAEGVETETQIERLRALGTDFFQGFYFARPMNKNDFIDWYNKNN
ncbi:bifunctional diguanylate cyclase/phosphodiesterase [Alteromonas sp. KUL49]|uniref:putative bifunctional diguanylate cyclase/phosphodiesterase n=1 Tax=Alteromonas sp. KUL49 TaxID=2480798 RepID=UPI00102F1D0F|nr:bifunctional diguanylate cyclase/phosphodiesterase [Alteromonas sp. KUL49]TAP41462.1 bifunctional diguanylate cyclase/phosphodiesterase [Alteromonas sp. KUL49]GEA10545.1 hypothetical protein KUL49_09200 [Alteromonas sp. KUL49]